MLSVVIPLCNEEESLNLLHKELSEIIPRLDKNYELIFVDDGSSDKSLEVLKEIAKKDKNIRIFSFRRNHGKAEALVFGFQKAKGDSIVTLDADLQDKPSEISKLIEKSKEGYDIVSGWRKNRKHPWFMKVPSKVFNFLVGSVWGLRLHDYNCGLKFYTKDAAKSLRIYGSLHRFIPLIAHQQGFKVTEAAVEHDKRKFGKSKYGFSKVWKDLPDLFTMLFLIKYGKKPLHFFWLIGTIFTIIGTIFIAYLTFIHYFYHESVGRRPLLFMGMLFVIAGFQIFFTGFLADLLINVSYKIGDSENNIGLKYLSEDSK